MKCGAFDACDRRSTVPRNSTPFACFEARRLRVQLTADLRFVAIGFQAVFVKGGVTSGWSGSTHHLATIVKQENVPSAISVLALVGIKNIPNFRCPAVSAGFRALHHLSSIDIQSGVAIDSLNV